MRKFQALSLSAALLASLLLGGCANNAASSDAASSDSAASEPEATPEPTPAPPAANPLTGAADADYTGKRPVAVTLRNMTGSTPQWGIASADVLVEGVTEGTTASLMALYANPDSIAKAGPVGPARDLLLQVALPLNAVPVHIDKNIYASNLLNTLAYQDLDGYHIGKTAFAFDQDRQNAGYAEENCWYTTAELINSGLASYGVSLNGDNTPLFQFGERPAVDPADRSGMNLTITFSPDDIDCLNYDTGTGHGIGYCLDIHEGPCKIVSEFSPLFPYAMTVPLDVGMLFSNEPGVYKKGRFGVRLENNIMVREDCVNEFGRFLKFETLTYCPFERGAIVKEMLTEEELEWLNAYHRKTYVILSPCLNAEEKAWLKNETAEM